MSRIYSYKTNLVILQISKVKLGNWTVSIMGVGCGTDHAKKKKRISAERSF